MKRFIILSTSIVSGLFVAILLASVLLLALVNPNDYKTQIEAQVKKSIQRDLHIKGDISWTFYPQLGLSSGEIELDNIAGFSRPHLVKIHKAAIGINILPLITGQISLSTLTLDGFSLSLLTDKQGFSNLDNMGKSAASIENKDDNKAVTAPTSNTDTNLKSNNKAQSEKPYFDISKTQLAGIEINNLVIEIEDLSRKQYQKIAINEISLGQFAFDQATPLSLRSEWIMNDIKASINLSTLLMIDRARHTIQLNKLQISTTLTMDALPNGQLKNTLKANIHYQVATQTVNINALQMSTDIDADNLPNKHIHSELSADVQYQVASQTATIKQLNLTLDKLLLGGEITVKTGAITKVRYQLSTNTLDLSPYLTSSEPAQNNATAATHATPANTAPEIEPDLSFLTGLDVKGDLNIAGVKMDNLTLGEINLHLTIKQGKAQIAPLTAKLYQGLLTVTASIDANKGLNKYKVSSKINGIQLAPLLNDVAELFLLSGNTSANFSGHGQGLTATKIQQGLIGQGGFTLLDGELHGINLSHEIRILKAKISGKKVPTSKHINKTDFGSLTGIFSIKKGLVNNQQLLMLSPAVRLDGTGLVHISKQTLDYQLGITNTTKESQYAGLTLPLMITGTFSAPKFSLDSSGALKSVLAAKKVEVKAKLKASLKKHAKKIDTKALKDKFKSFF